MAPSPAELLGRFGRYPRRVAVLAVVICALALTLAVPLRIYVSQRQQLAETVATEAQLTAEVSELESRLTQLNDPSHVQAQARERLRYVMPGQTPYQVQLPADEGRQQADGADGVPGSGPWYSELWSTVRSTGE